MSKLFIYLAKYIDRLSWPALLFFAILLALLPFKPQAHLLEKLQMLWALELYKPIDIFDLLMHSSGILVIAIKLYRQIANKK